MTPKTKTLLTIAIVTASAFAYYGYTRFKRLKAIFDALVISPAGLPKNLKFTPENVSFTIDIQIENPTGEAFDVNAYFAKLSKIKIFYKNAYIGTSTVNLEEISVPAHNVLVLKNIEVVVSFADAIDIVTNFAAFSMNDFTFSAIVEVAGNSFEITN